MPSLPELPCRRSVPPCLIAFVPSSGRATSASAAFVRSSCRRSTSTTSVGSPFRFWVERLVAIAEAAPYGRGEETVVDRDVRRTWQIEPGKVRIGGRHWAETLAELVADAALGLGVSEPVAAEFYKLLVYDAGSFFVGHRDTEKAPGMFATMVLMLPSAHSGGELIIKHLGREVVLDPRPEEPSEIGFAAFYADCVHEVRPITAGCRLALVYSLRFLGKKRPPQPPDYRTERRRIEELLRLWTEATDEADKLILPLEHAYTPAELSFETLKGRDAAVASVLAAAAAEANCDVHLVLVSIEESGSAEHSGHYGHRRRGWSEEDEFEVSEVCERALVLSHWRRPHGGEAGFGDFPFSEDELCPPDAFEDLTPAELHFHEATGNEGASFERTYRRAGLVLWPRVRRLAVLNQAGLGATLPHLEDLTTRWEASAAGIESPLWSEADELSGHMLRSWPRSSWRRDGDTEAGRMLDLQVRLGNVARIDAFLAELSAQGHYAASDNEAIVRAVVLLPRVRATDLVVRIIRRNAPAHLGACGDLLRRCVAAPASSMGEPASIGAALVDVLPGDPAKPAVLDIGQRPAPVKPDFVVDLLTALSRIDAQPRGERCRASAGLAQNIQAGRCPGPGRSGLRQAGREHRMAGGRAAAHGVSRPLAQADRPAAGGPTRLGPAQPGQMHMRRLPRTRHVSGCRRSTGMAPESAAGPAEPC
jgi:predicted 2-oxoglutarate/Fe(II)-dependent dioxygenase YbiX